MIVLDASILIAHFDQGDAHNAAAGARLREAGGDALGASPITLAEVLVEPARKGRLAEAQAALRRLDVVEVPLPSDAARRLAELRATTGLKLPDCCVLLAAQAVGGRVLTFDERLARAAAELRLRR